MGKTTESVSSCYRETSLDKYCPSVEKNQPLMVVVY